ncbi:ATP-binding cassette domain-containing protein [Microbacterium galbinum]|uniref:ABC transporter ATP-binding protein n=1 Tax=Microbacterium galbinum TaxID=2851646 RepID=A0ABY4ISP7_9MICO|nr:ABC transporter ATP-binding protein [Microbacterium galbinum]UPL15708.1 ABC transporter ATP-binding protein [Microbacterium galbinum]
MKNAHTAIDRAASIQESNAAVENETSREEVPERKIKLRTLAPEYKGDHHSLYVRHLEQAIEERKNRNIALTGRYGAGKSSVLDAFEKKHEAETVRISINTLGPDEDDEDLTNRIQKELVKQLVYRLKPGQVRRSRFARPKPLTKWTALWQALGVAAVALSLLWLLGVRPSADWPGAQANVFVQLGLGLLFFSLVVLVVWAVRWLIGDKFVSEVSTAGTKIALSDGPTTYFDSFLDEIVAFFDAVEPEFVIFEDLDRFDDPQIFDSLRELNTLVNASAHWKSKEHPLRFIYAIKDSLFEQLGSDAALKDDTRDEQSSEASVRTPTVVGTVPKPDLAAEAVRRANRTKFFEMVIPMVPFLSHRNARDHLSDALTALGFPKDYVSRPLLDLVARHTTDMRLMINICNEFAVFVERLLWSENPAPGMTADHLFALVVYKNFHMADFENIAQRTSTLDDLEQHHRDEVRALIEGLQKQRRTTVQLEAHRARRTETASALGQRLQDMKAAFPNPYSNYPVSFVTGGKTFAFDAIQGVDFWAQVASSRAITVNHTHAGAASMDGEQIDRLFPELNSVARWRTPDADRLTRMSEQSDDDIAILRGADFVELAAYGKVPEGRTPFAQWIHDDLESELARDLVRKGFITRNFAEYSAIFYGNFVGVDVAYFYNHSVQPNEMYLDFKFKTENAVSNLLEQVPSDFTSTVSALNIDVVDHLLQHQPVLAKEAVAYIVSHEASKDVQTFLESHFNMPDAQHEKLVELLAEDPWHEVFEYLADHHAIPDLETRLRLFNAALLHAQAVDSYDIGEAAMDFLDQYHPRMTAITAEHSPVRIARVLEILESAEIVVPDLSRLSKPLREHVVARQMYEISVPNLKQALEIETAPTLDEVRKNEHVWEHCRSRIDDYLKAVQGDETIECIVQSESVLVDVINEQHESWTDDQLWVVIEGSSDAVKIAELQQTPEPVWPMLVGSHHVLPSAVNVVDYAKEHGVDEQLAGFLSPDDAEPIELLDLDEIEDDERGELVIKLLNASEHLTAEDRVALACQVSPADGFDLGSVTPSPDQLLARGLAAGLFEDDLPTFSHFAPGGWEATSEAFEVSQKVASFMSPTILQGYVAEFLTSPNSSKRLKRIVVICLQQYVPNDDARALRAAGEFARTESLKLPLDEVRRIARVAKAVGAVMRQLVLSAKDISADDVVEVVSMLGAPYTKLADGPGAKFDYPSGVPSLDTVFKHLETAGRIKVTKKLFGSGRTVEVLV